jgi:hypothetical protein
MDRRKGAIAAAAASLLLGATGVAALAGSATAEDKVKCEGVNSCKGHSACKTLFSKCSGQNECKGKGFLMLTPEECDAAKAKMESGEKEG